MIRELQAWARILEPIVDPVVAKLGIDPNQLAMIVVYNLTLCIIAPRVGGLLFVMSSDSRVPIGPLVRERVPF